MVKINKYYKVSSFAPTQWIGKTDNNESVYIRYRKNNLKVIIGSPPVRNHPDSKTIINKHIDSDDGHSGRMKSRIMVGELENTSVNIDYKSEKSQYDEDLKAVWDSMADYTRDIDVDS